jgi:hypothetical protein
MNEIPLRDIHLPDLSLWWPPAAGWWLLAILVALALVYLPRLLRWWRLKPVKKLSMRELKRIRLELKNSDDEQRALEDLSVLLRRTVMSYCGRGLSASLSGNSWVRQLEQLAGINCFSAEQNDWLSAGQYSPTSRCNTKSMIDSCENWIRALPRRYIDAAN